MGDEYSYRAGSFTNILGRPPCFYHSNDLLPSGCRFASVYAVRKEDAIAIAETAQTAAGFRGVVWSRRLWVDFDNQEGAIRAEEYLRKEGYDYVAYDTGGGRGKHFGILRDCLPSHTLPAQDKAWVKEHLPGADLGLYWHLHLLRLPGAIHENTGRPKVLLHRVPGKALVLPPLADIEENIQRDVPQSTNRESIFRCWEVVSNLQGDGVDGSRHKQLVQLAIALKNDAKVTYEEASWVTQEVNKGFSVPKEPSEVQRIVKWAFGLEG